MRTASDSGVAREIVKRTGSPTKHPLARMWGPGALFVLPAVLFLVVMLAFPLAYTAWLSLHYWQASSIVQPIFVGLENYVDAFTDARFLLGVWRTFYYTFLSVGLEGVIGLAVALLLHREFRGRGIIRTLFLLPMVATPVAISLVWLMMYDPATGVIGFAMKAVGLPAVNWTSNPHLVIPALAIVDIWQWTPLVALICLAGLSALPNEPFEASTIDGASRWQTFRFITLPLLRPAIVVALLFRAIDALKYFDTIWVITGGGPGFASETLNIYVYKVAFEYLNMGYASSLLVIFFVIVMGVSLVMIKLRRGSW